MNTDTDFFIYTSKYASVQSFVLKDNIDGVVGLCAENADTGVTIFLKPEIARSLGEALVRFADMAGE